MKGLFVIGTDTGVGKTLVCSLLMAAASPQVRYWKPVQTGEDDDERDRGRDPEQRHGSERAGDPIDIEGDGVVHRAGGDDGQRDHDQEYESIAHRRPPLPALRRRV